MRRWWIPVVFVALFLATELAPAVSGEGVGAGSGLDAQLNAERSLLIQEAQSALRRDPTDPAPHLVLGEAYFQIGNVPAAGHHLEMFLRTAPSGPDSLRAAYLDARLLVRRGLRLRATRALRHLVTRPGATAEMWHDYSLLLHMDRMNPEAIMAEMTALERGGRQPQLLREAANQWKELRHLEGAIECWTALAATGEAEAEDHFQLGLAYHRLRQFDPARVEYEAALQTDPAHPEAHYNLSLVESSQGDRESAIHHLEQVLRLRPEYEPAYFELGRLFLIDDKPVEAQSVFRRFLLVSQDSLALGEAEALIRDIEKSRHRR
ncbi:MAG: tetratricopeptide repeat protein [Candidatus Eisenbacteria bacterium]